MFNIPKSSEYLWTRHAQAKMNYYKISPARVRRVIKSPARIEEGIAPDTVAFMQPVSYKTKNGKRTWTQEFWVMAAQSTTNNKRQTTNDTKSKEFSSSKPLVVGSRLRIISAWRYPGMTKPGAPLPSVIIDEIKEALSG